MHRMDEGILPPSKARKAWGNAVEMAPLICWLIAEATARKRNASGPRTERGRMTRAIRASEWHS